jgi:hypothetical protein
VKAVYLEQELSDIRHLELCGLATRGDAERKHRLWCELARDSFRKQQRTMADALSASPGDKFEFSVVARRVE